MWVITHIPSGQTILGLNLSDKGFYSYKEAHRFLLSMNRILKLGVYLFSYNFTGYIPSKYVTVITRLTYTAPKVFWETRRVSKRKRIINMSRLFAEYHTSLEDYTVYLKGNKIITLLCDRTSIRSKTEQLKPINKSEFLIHYVN